MDVLVTGAGGFVGSVVSRRLLDAGHAVVASVRRPGATARLDRLGVTASDACRIVVGDLADGLDVPPVNAVVHAAASLQGDDPDRLERDNVAASERLCEWAVGAGVTRLVLVSSTSVYGAPHVEVIDEETEPVDVDAYGRSKQRTEALVATSGIPWLALRLPGVLGPRPTAGPWLVSVVDRARRGEDVHLHSPEASFNAAVLVDDVADAAARALQVSLPSTAVNLAAGEPLPVAVVVQRVLDGLGSSSRVVVDDARRPPALLAVERLVTVLGLPARSMTSVIDGYLAWATSGDAPE